MAHRLIALLTVLLWAAAPGVRASNMGSEITISALDNEQSVPAVAFAEGPDEYLVVWQNQWGGGEFAVAAWPDDEYGTAVASCHGLDGYLVAWQNSQTDIYARFVTGDGIIDGPPIHIEDKPLDDQCRAGRGSLLLGSIQTPLHPAAGGHVEKDKAVEHGQLSVVDAWKERLGELKLPVKLEISHGHGAAREEGRPTRLEPNQEQDSADELNEPTNPKLREDFGFAFGEEPEDLLYPVHRKHEPGDDAQQSVGMVGIIGKSFHGVSPWR